MTNPDRSDTAPGMGDPTRSDDIASPGLRSDTGGSTAATDGGADEGRVAGTAPAAGATDKIRPRTRGGRADRDPPRPRPRPEWTARQRRWRVRDRQRVRELGRQPGRRGRP